MKLFIGYLIEAEAKKWHQNLTRDISEKFNTWKIWEKVPPHITIFRPFEIENIEMICTLLKTWTEKSTLSGKFIMSGFGRFDDRVVFADIKTDLIAKDMVNNLRSELRNVSDMPPEDYPTWNPHATLAELLDPTQIDAIWKYVQAIQKPYFELPFNNVTTFQSKGNREWIVLKKFQIA